MKLTRLRPSVFSAHRQPTVARSLVRPRLGLQLMRRRYVGVHNGNHNCSWVYFDRTGRSGLARSYGENRLARGGTRPDKVRARGGALLAQIVATLQAPPASPRWVLAPATLAVAGSFPS